MRFLLLAAQNESSVRPQTIGRDWWSTATFDGFPTANLPRAGILLVDASESRSQAADWISKALLAGNKVFVLDQGASEREIDNWLDRGVSDVIEVAESAIERVEEASSSTSTSAAPRLIGCSPEMLGIRERIQLVASRKCSVLIEGETGTGKEVVARAIHAESDRKNGPWVAVNCAAIPESLLEAELFGHVRGAFTGAIQGRMGKFEAANRGTIFLDEIGEMPVSVQSKLLRVLQEREIERLGGNERVPLDVRVIAATNARLEEAVRQGKFRQDLYYRLHVVLIQLPPLRERPGDVALLARKFVQRICENENLKGKHLGSDALAALTSYSWPGNVRELENRIESAVILSGKRRTLRPEDFDIQHGKQFSDWQSTEFSLPPGGIEYQKALEDFERNLLTQALHRVRGNKTAAAELLGLKRTTLAAKLKTLENRLPRLVA